MATSRDAIKKAEAPEPAHLLLEMNREITAAGGRLYLDYGDVYGPSIDNLLVRSQQPDGLREDSLSDLAHLAQLAVEFRGPVAVAFIWSLTKIIIRIIDLFDARVAIRTTDVEILISRPRARVKPHDVLTLVTELNARNREPNKTAEQVLRASPKRLNTLLKNLIGRP